MGHFPVSWFYVLLPKCSTCIFCLCVTAVVVLDYSGLCQQDMISYSLHRLLEDLREILGAFTPWLVYKIVVYKYKFAKLRLWELFRYYLCVTLPFRHQGVVWRSFVGNGSLVPWRLQTCLELGLPGGYM